MLINPFEMQIVTRLSHKSFMEVEILTECPFLNIIYIKLSKKMKDTASIKSILGKLNFDSWNIKISNFFNRRLSYCCFIQCVLNEMFKMVCNKEKLLSHSTPLSPTINLIVQYFFYVQNNFFQRLIFKNLRQKKYL